VADAGFLHRFYVRAEHVERGGDVVAIGTERKTPIRFRAFPDTFVPSLSW
jgi:hypothetical protein